MRKIFGVWMACFAFSVAAHAQPQPATVPATDLPRPVLPRIGADEEEILYTWLTRAAPEEVATSMVNGFDPRELKHAAFSVAGADWKSPELKLLGDFLKPMKRVAWRADFDPKKKLAVPADATEVSVKVRVSTEDDLISKVWRDEEVTLRHKTTKWGDVWQVMPEDPQAIFTSVFEASPDVGVVRRLATYLAYPKAARLWLAMGRSQNQMRQLGTGLMMYTQDWGGKLPPDAATFRTSIQPYIRSDDLFTVPGDEAGRQSYNVNSQLAGKSMADLKSPTETVAIYLGKDNTLDFRFDGLTIVGFADGHVQIVNEEEAKNLRWKP